MGRFSFLHAPGIRLRKLRELAGELRFRESLKIGSETGYFENFFDGRFHIRYEEFAVQFLDIIQLLDEHTDTGRIDVIQFFQIDDYVIIVSIDILFEEILEIDGRINVQAPGKAYYVCIAGFSNADFHDLPFPFRRNRPEFNEFLGKIRAF